jgi:type I restriction enzyme R subunit
MLVASSIYEACKYFALFQKTPFRGKCAIVTSYNPLAKDVTKEEVGANTETDRQFVYNSYRELLKDVAARPGMSKTETYEEDAKARFTSEPANMKLLVVVDKLLTGFDAPHCTYLYIDKSMQDHGLFQAICRTNRLDGEDKDFGYIVDYKDLFKKVQDAVSVYSSELDHSSGGAAPEILLQDRLAKGRQRLDASIEALALLCEGVERPKGELEYLHYFCGNTEIKEDLEARAELRSTLYLSVVGLLRAYANIADELEGAGYSPGRVAEIKGLRDHYLKMREAVRKAANESLDLKAYEADMRHLLDTYIEADESRKISPFDGMGLVDLIVKSGMAAAIETLPEGVKSRRDAVAETIENNVRSKLMRERLTDPAFYEKMSALLDEVIKFRKERAEEYEEYLRKIAELARQVQAGHTDDLPEALRRSPGLRALYNNLKGGGSSWNGAKWAAERPGEAPGHDGSSLDLALRLDAKIKAVRPDSWRGVQAKEQVIKGALYEVLQDDAEVERLFPIVKAQAEY